jgi:putative hemolysin
LMDVNLPTNESDTLGGYIYTVLGRVPAVGNTIRFEDLEFTVESVEGRRISKVRVRRQTSAPAREEMENGRRCARAG